MLEWWELRRTIALRGTRSGEVQGMRWVRYLRKAAKMSFLALGRVGAYHRLILHFQFCYCLVETTFSLVSLSGENGIFSSILVRWTALYYITLFAHLLLVRNRNSVFWLSGRQCKVSHYTVRRKWRIQSFDCQADCAHSGITQSGGMKKFSQNIVRQNKFSVKTLIAIMLQFVNKIT